EQMLQPRATPREKHFGMEATLTGCVATRVARTGHGLSWVRSSCNVFPAPRANIPSPPRHGKLRRAETGEEYGFVHEEDGEVRQSGAALAAGLRLHAESRRTRSRRLACETLLRSADFLVCRLQNSGSRHCVRGCVTP